jgi:hypothetical protein
MLWNVKIASCKPWVRWIWPWFLKANQCLSKPSIFSKGVVFNQISEPLSYYGDDGSLVIQGNWPGSKIWVTARKFRSAWGSNYTRKLARKWNRVTASSPLDHQWQTTQVMDLLYQSQLGRLQGAVQTSATIKKGQFLRPPLDAGILYKSIQFHKKNIWFGKKISQI